MKAQRQENGIISRGSEIDHDLGLVGSEGLLEGSHLLTDSLLALVVGETGLLELEGAVLSDGLLLGSLWGRVGADGLVGLGVHGLKVVGVDASLDELGELASVALLVLLLQLAHVVGNMSAHDVRAEDLSVELLLLLVPAGEAVLAVRDVEAAVDGTLEGGEDLGAGAGAAKTGVEECLEGARALLVAHVRGALGDAEGGQDAAGDKETGAVDGGVVGESNLDAEARELMGVGGSEDVVALDAGVDDLADDVGVGDADDEAVLGDVVLVLVLDDEALAGVVVGLALAAAAVLGLEALEVGLVLGDLDERL
jgi:hypothetical protein